MGEGYTDPQGRFRPTGGKKKGGAAVVAVGAAAAIAWSSAGWGGGAGAGAGGTSGVTLSPGMNAKVVEARAALRTGKPAKAWRRLGLKQRAKQTAQALNCAGHSFGAVQAYFVASPCRSLDRMVLPLADPEGNTIMLSVAWVRMSGTRQAARLKLLVDVHGSGDVDPLGVEALRRRGVTFTGLHYDSDSTGAVVTIAEAEPMHGRPSDELLEAVATVGVKLPKPKAGRR